MSTKSIPITALPSFFKDIEIVDTDCVKNCQLLVSEGLKQQRIDSELYTEQTPMLFCNNKVKKIYQSNNFAKIKKLEQQAQADLQPIYDNLKRSSDDAWTKVRVSGEEFYMVWSDRASMWVRPIDVKYAEDNQKYQMSFEVGTYSESTSVLGIQTYNFSVSVVLPAVVLALVLALALGELMATGLAFTVATFSLILLNVTSRLGIGAFSCMVPATAVSMVSVALVFVVAFIGIMYLLSWLNRKYTIRLQVFNWDETSDWEINRAYHDNAVIAGSSDKEIKNLVLRKKIEPSSTVFPPGFQPVEVLDSVCYYGTMIWENDNTFMEGCSMALAIQKQNTNQGFMWAFSCPRFGDNKQAARNGISDPKTYLEDVTWNNNPKDFSITTTDANITIQCAMDFLSGADDNFYNINIHIGK